jgi:hypothetical protein
MFFCSLLLPRLIPFLFGVVGLFGRVTLIKSNFISIFALGCAVAGFILVLVTAVTANPLVLNLLGLGLGSRFLKPKD